MKNIALILQNRPDTRLHIENYSDPSDGSIHIRVQLQDARTGQRLARPLDWCYDLQEALDELDGLCAGLGKRWAKPVVNIGVR